MAELDSALRNALESQIVKARDVSEAAADAALRGLAVHQRDALPHHNEDRRALRRALRTKARQLGDPLERDPNDPMPALTRELAYERWHQMLFATFLAHNHLLIHPTENVPVTLQDCEELATHEGDPDGWHTAARYASHMLPGIFKPTDPLLQVHYAPEHHQTLERILNDIPPPTYTSDDGLGWVYQFWQTKRKKQVNESGRKIGGADIAPVTQLFTEHYMVQFLLHNTLGAWWTARHPDIPLPTSKSYLRTLDDGTPAAGTFDGWPTTAKDITVMDPCCGSGHFLTAAFTLLQRFRMHEENLTEAEAGDAVLRDNLHGLELDPRCTQLAAFNLALHAWKRGGYRPLPPLNIACSGIPSGGTETDWTSLTDDPRAKSALKRLHHLFKNAPDLGSLIDPNRLAEADPLYTATYDEIEAHVEEATAGGNPGDPTRDIFGVVVKSQLQATRLLTAKYTLVSTNVPYLGTGLQNETLRLFSERYFARSKHDLATVFAERCADYCVQGGTYALVTPQNWLFLARYKDFRRSILAGQEFNLLAELGNGAFTTPLNVKPLLSVITPRQPRPTHQMSLASATDGASVETKAQVLVDCPILIMPQKAQLAHPDSRVLFAPQESAKALSAHVESHLGLGTGDSPKYVRQVWEFPRPPLDWTYLQGPVGDSEMYGGRSSVVRWDHDAGRVGGLTEAERAQVHNQDWSGRGAWGKMGVVISLVGSLNATLYTGNVHYKSTAVLVPKERSHLAALWAFASSSEFSRRVRVLDKKTAVANATLTRVPFELDQWLAIADQTLPTGLPRPHSDDPTQWLFHGHPAPATKPLQVAVARLLGYRWPAETDPDMELSDEARAWIARSAELTDLADSDGIVCLPPVAGEKPASERLRALLATAYADQWSPTTEAALLATVGYDGKTLHDWLSGDFFKQHCTTFNNRPFIWHISDGTKDGFSALVNYHKLDRALLERLIYTYLGSYIRQQQDAAKSSTRGADLKLAKAEELKTKLELILDGEEPYDIFVRWKPLHEQPIGWEPDLNDGVRLNIRPFVAAGVLRSKFTINWNKDRGNDPTPNATGTTERHNDRHLTHQQKHDARKAHRS